MRHLEQSVRLVEYDSGSNIIPGGICSNVCAFPGWILFKFQGKVKSWVEILTEWKSFSGSKIRLCFAAGVNVLPPWLSWGDIHGAVNVLPLLPPWGEVNDGTVIVLPKKCIF